MVPALQSNGCGFEPYENHGSGVPWSPVQTFYTHIVYSLSPMAMNYNDDELCFAIELKEISMN